MSQSLTPQEAGQIKQFVRNGGTVIADLMAGVRDEHLVPQVHSPLDEVFGIERGPYRTGLYRGRLRLHGSYAGLSVDLTLPDREMELALLTTGVPLGELNDSYKGFIVNRYGKGQALYMSFTIDGYLRDRAMGIEGPTLHLFADLMAWAGISPRVRVGRGEERLPATEIARFVVSHETQWSGVPPGGLELTMICRDPYSQDQKPRRAEVRWTEKAHLYDARAKRCLGFTDCCQKTFSPGRMEVFARLPYRVEGVRLRYDGRISAGDAVTLQIAIENGGQPGVPHVFHLECAGPDGKVRDYYTKNVLADDGRCEFRWQTAFNDTPGAWTVSATEVVSGRTAEAKVEIYPPHIHSLAG
jgi:hypothetical protein